MSLVETVSQDVFRYRTLMANVYFVRDGASWVLVDAGLYGYGPGIARAAARLFGPRSRPAAIVLTHGHFDHVGALTTLANRWDVPVYAHALEHPYLNGQQPYAPPDPTVGGGLMARLSPLYPRGPVDVRPRLRTLPADGEVPALPHWHWIHTPGHSEGHVSLFREADRTLIAGDAVVTTRQESAIDVLTQHEIVWRPPAYYTTDWDDAAQSVRQLAALAPEYLATGHGHALRGTAMRRALNDLADHFDAVRPRHGRYVQAERREAGRRSLRAPRPRSTATRVVSAVVAMTLAAAAVNVLLKRN